MCIIFKTVEHEEGIIINIIIIIIIIIFITIKAKVILNDLAICHQKQSSFLEHQIGSCYFIDM